MISFHLNHLKDLIFKRFLSLCQISESNWNTLLIGLASENIDCGAATQ